MENTDIQETKLKKKSDLSKLFAIKFYVLDLIGNFVSRYGSAVDSIAYSWMVYQLTGSTILMGTIFAVKTIPNIIFGTLGGVLVDRLKKRTIMIFCNVGMGISVCLTAILYWNHSLSVWEIFMFTIINAMLEVFSSPAGTSLFAHIVPKELYLSANSFSSSLFQFAELLGAGTAGVIIYAFGIAGGIFVDGLSFLFAALMISFITFKETITVTKKLNVKVYFSELKEGFSYIKNHTLIFISVFLCSMINFCIVPLNVYTTVFVKTVLKSGTITLSILSTCLSIGMIAAGFLVATFGKKFKTSTLILFGMITFGVYYAVLSFTGVLPSIGLSRFSIIFCAVLFFLMGMSMTIIISPLTAYFLEFSPKEMLGRLASVFNMVAICAMPLGSFLSGIFIKYIPLTTLFLIMGILMLVVTLPLLFYKDFRNA